MYSILPPDLHPGDPIALIVMAMANDITGQREVPLVNGTWPHLYTTWRTCTKLHENARGCKRMHPNLVDLLGMSRNELNCLSELSAETPATS